MTGCNPGGLCSHIKFIVVLTETCRVSVRLTTSMLIVVDCHQFSGVQRHAGDTTAAWRAPTATERPLERLSELGAESRVEHEIHGAVDHHEQVAEVAADRQLQSACRGQCAWRGDQVDGVQLLDGLRQLTDEEDDDDAD